MLAIWDSNRRLTRQRKHLVYGNTGSDDGVTHRSFADLTLNVCSTNLCNPDCWHTL